MKILFLLFPWLIGSYFLGIVSNILWNKYLKYKENKIKIVAETEAYSKKLKEIPTNILTEEFLNRTDTVNDLLNK